MFEEESNTDLEDMQKLEEEFGEEPIAETDKSDVPKDETPDTATDTPVKEETTSETSDTDTETLDESTTEEVVDDPNLEAFKASGLDKTYADPAAAYAAIAEKEAEIGRLRKQQAEDRGREQPPDPTQQDQSFDDKALREFYQNDPEGAYINMAKVFMEQSNTLATLQAENSFNRAKIDNPDIVNMKTQIDEKIQSDPVLKYINRTDPGWAATTARAFIIAGKPKPEIKKTVQVKPVSDAEKAGAVTTTHGKTPQRKSGERSLEEYENMTIEEFENDPVIGLREI